MKMSLEESMFDFLSMLSPLSADDFVVDPAPEIQPGSIHNIAGVDHIALESFMNGTTAVLRKDFLRRNRKFGNNCCWTDSELRAYLNGEYYRDLADAIGEENIVPFHRDLTSMDGLDDYGSCEDHISLLTMDEYRKYHKLLGLRPNYPSWWWLCTPFSTESAGYSRYVCCVSSDGRVDFDGCDHSNGVRPFYLIQSLVLSS